MELFEQVFLLFKIVLGMLRIEDFNDEISTWFEEFREESEHRFHEVEWAILIEWFDPCRIWRHVRQNYIELAVHIQLFKIMNVENIFLINPNVFL